MALEQCVLGMYGYVLQLRFVTSSYISDCSHVDFDGEVTPIVIKAKGFA